MLEAGNTTIYDITSEWTTEKATDYVVPGVKEFALVITEWTFVYSRGSNIAANKGGTMNLLFHPYVKIYFFAWDEKAFFIEKKSYKKRRRS